MRHGTTNVTEAIQVYFGYPIKMALADPCGFWPRNQME